MVRVSVKGGDVESPGEAAQQRILWPDGALRYCLMRERGKPMKGCGLGDGGRRSGLLRRCSIDVGPSRWGGRCFVTGDCAV